MVFSIGIQRGNSCVSGKEDEISGPRAGKIPRWTFGKPGNSTSLQGYPAQS